MLNLKLKIALNAPDPQGRTHIWRTVFESENEDDLTADRLENWRPGVGEEPIEYRAFAYDPEGKKKTLRVVSEGVIPPRSADPPIEGV